MPAPVSYALQHALGMGGEGNPVRDRASAARAALDALVGGMAGSPLADVRRTPDYEPTPRPEPAAAAGMALGAVGQHGGGANPEFVRRLQALIAATGGKVRVQGGAWGYRTNAEQAALYRQKPGLAAPPGRSNHERGTAADLSGDLALAHRLAGQFGLRFPMLTRAPGKKFEPWHIEIG